MRTMMFGRALFGLLLAQSCQACDLCAIYNADNTVAGSSSGFSFSIAPQYIPYRTTQFEGEEVEVPNPSYVDSLITHLVPAYNFSESFGINFNVPVTYLKFRRTDVEYSPGELPDFKTEKGTEFGLGDMALIGRVTVFQHREMEYGILVNILGGVKFPTGDASRLSDEVEQSRIYESLLPPGTVHEDPLGHSISSVHQHSLALGSGSYDGIFGLTLNTRWQRWFFNSQFQYYLRTEGEAGFTYGDEIMVSGGPGLFITLSRAATLSLQFNVVYDTMGRDELLGRLSDQTGMTGWYVGPLMSLSWGNHFSANVGIDLPLNIENNGFQSVPDYRLHGGVSWRF
jgi:hypothetical protein